MLSAVIRKEGDLPVAGSTLLVAFNPLRKGIQDIVDRRFNRARYNARRLVESFSHGLRTAHDLDGIGAELRQAVAFTMQPSSYAVWLTGPPGTPSAGADDGAGEGPSGG